MTARMLATTVLAVFSTSAAAASYAWFDRPEAAGANSHSAVSNDVYVRGFGWAWGELRLSPDTPSGAAMPTPGRQARDKPEHGAIVPWRQQDENGPPRHPRGKLGMNLAAEPMDAASGGSGARHPLAVVR
ncbi:hypothetical protein [Cupriavidus sp. UYPR2.512]|uniref:hypothetical protein n=1 Tax=Cupriavidus sp. UYPR2.512 TaxID=1080187 RepID=UPI0003A150C5|nr:hypothetical protein [Cupriavidus sp. UYPR2.512]UIF91615.1 hypothetical protein KAF44_36760 [Cupriavidus necator]